MNKDDVIRFLEDIKKELGCSFTVEFSDKRDVPVYNTVKNEIVLPNILFSDEVKKVLRSFTDKYIMFIISHEAYHCKTASEKKANMYASENSGLSMKEASVLSKVYADLITIDIYRGMLKSYESLSKLDKGFIRVCRGIKRNINKLEKRINLTKKKYGF